MSNDELIIGQEVRDFIKVREFSTNQLSEFYSHVRKYNIAVCDYVITKLPLTDELLRNAMVANPRKRLDVAFSVLYFARRFHLMEDRLDDLESEFAHYQVDTQLNDESPLKKEHI